MKFNLGELGPANLCLWPIASCLDGADLWGNGELVSRYRSLLAVLPHPLLFNLLCWSIKSINFLVWPGINTAVPKGCDSICPKTFVILLFSVILSIYLVLVLFLFCYRNFSFSSSFDDLFHFPLFPSFLTTSPHCSPSLNAEVAISCISSLFMCVALSLSAFFPSPSYPALYLFSPVVVVKSGQCNHMYAATNTTGQAVNQHIVCDWLVTRRQPVAQSDREPRVPPVAPNNPFSFFQTHVLAAVILF